MGYYLQKAIKNLLEPKKLKVLAIICTLAVAVGSLISIQGEIKTSFIHLDKFVHFLAYGILCLLWLKVYVLKNKKLKLIIIVAGLVLAYGIIIEALQEVTTSYRQFDILDIIANFLGILVAVGIFWAVYLKKRVI